MWITLAARELGHTEATEDAAALFRQGMAVCLAGAFGRAAPLLAASARRLREQERLRLLRQVLSIYAWAAVEVGDFAVATTAAEESRRLASEVERPEWDTGAQISQAQLAALRGDRGPSSPRRASVTLAPVGEDGEIGLVSPTPLAKLPGNRQG